MNANSGDTPVLDLVDLAVSGTRDYTWDAAGNLDSVAPGGNLIDFTFDDASRLTAADHPASGASAAFLYDGRGFLRSATQTAGGTASVTPLYDSSGLLHALRRKPSPTDPLDTTYVFYLAGRPVAQLQIDGTGTETWTYLTTDHLGTPLVATDQTGAITWEGGFQPFGTDYQAGTGNGASDNGILLRLPGQWDDGTWDNATSGAGVYYNVYRWYAPAVGRYTRPDPVWEADYFNLNPYVFALGNPVNFWDPDGRRYNPPPIAGYFENNSKCPLLTFGDVSPSRLSEPIVIKAAESRFHGLIRNIGRSPFFGDVDFVCLGGTWYKIRGPAWATEDRQLRSVLPSRPANAQEHRELPPCVDPPCQCTLPGQADGR